MIYQFSRYISGPYLNRLIDYYIEHQSIFNVIVIVVGFIWIYYSRKKKKTDDKEEKNFFGIKTTKKTK